MDKQLQTIGRAEHISFPKLNITVPARVDTGARTSAIWASNIKVVGTQLQFVLFDKSSEYYNGEVLTAVSYGTIPVTSSMGTVEERYVVKLLVQLEGRKINASFTLANRSTQVYPVLVGRNILRGKFIVNVKLAGAPVKAQKEATS